MGRLSGLGFQLCELSGVAGVRIIESERVSELFRSRTSSGTNFIVLALGLKGLPSIRYGKPRCLNQFGVQLYVRLAASSWW